LFQYPDIISLLQLLLANPIPPELSTSTRPAAASPSEVNPLFDLKEITSFILDAEIVAIDKTTGAFRTFQELSNRAKKDVQAADVKVGVGVFAFDLMLLNQVVSRTLPSPCLSSVSSPAHPLTAPSASLSSTSLFDFDDTSFEHSSLPSTPLHQSLRPPSSPDSTTSRASIPHLPRTLLLSSRSA